MMKNYVKPIVLANEELAEGVYAASGAVGNANCWTISVRSDQDWNGSHHVFEVTIVHSDTVQHISTESTSVLTFSHALTDAYTESDFSASFGGNTMMWFVLHMPIHTSQVTEQRLRCGLRQKTKPPQRHLLLPLLQSVTLARQ